MHDPERDHTNWPIDAVLRRLGWDGHQKQRGRWRDIRCPFHHDRNIGNAGFNPQLNSFRCQACGAAGNSVTLVMRQLHMDEKAAVEWLDSGVGRHAVTSSGSHIPNWLQGPAWKR